MAAKSSQGLQACLYPIADISFPKTLKDSVVFSKFSPITLGGGKTLVIESISAGKNPTVTLIDPAHTPSMLPGFDAATLGGSYGASGDAWETPTDGDIVFFQSRTGCGDALDNRFFIIDNVGGSATAPTFRLIGADTTGKTFANDPDGLGEASCHVRVIRHADESCLTSIDFSPSTPNEISIANFCDPSQTIPSTVQSGGTISISGFVEQSGDPFTIAYDLKTADSPVDQKYLFAVHLPKVVKNGTQANEPKYIGEQGVILAEVKPSEYIVDLPLDGVVGFSGTLECLSPIYHQFML